MVGNKSLSLLSNMFTNLNLTDMETPHRVFKASLMQSIQIEEDGFGVQHEFVGEVARAGCRTYEVGISYSGRTIAKEKINWKDGVRALYAISNIIFQPINVTQSQVSRTTSDQTPHK